MLCCLRVADQQMVKMWPILIATQKLDGMSTNEQLSGLSTILD